MEWDPRAVKNGDVDLEATEELIAKFELEIHDAEAVGANVRRARAPRHCARKQEEGKGQGAFGEKQQRSTPRPNPLCSVRSARE